MSETEDKKEAESKKEPQVVKDITLGTDKTGRAFGFRPANFQEFWRFSTMISRTDMIPREFSNNPGKILTAVQMGFEVGLPPMQALQNIAVINGRPVLWGDGALAVVRAHPLCESVVERGPVEALAANAGQCTIKRKDQSNPITRDFTLEMAETAGLVKRSGPEGPWTKYRGRMLMFRARAWAMRDALPEALKGLGIREENPGHGTHTLSSGNAKEVIGVQTTSGKES